MSAMMHVASDVAHLPAAMPTMSHILQKWLEERSVTPGGSVVKRLSDAIPLEEKIEKLAQECGRLEQVGIALRVMQGFILLQASALGEDSLRQVVNLCDMPLVTAQRCVDLFQLFNVLGDLKLVGKAEQLGVRRIRELKPYFGIDGIRQLIEGAELAGLKYSMIEALPSREITLWVRNRRAEELQAMAAKSMAGEHSLSSGYVEEPRALVVARDELTSNLLRARVEVELAFKEMHLISDELPQEAVDDLMQFVAMEAKGVIALLNSLRTACGKATDRNINEPLGDLATLPNALLDERSTFAANAATLDLAKRASARQKAHGWKGRPPASLESVLKHARRDDATDSDGE